MNNRGSSFAQAIRGPIMLITVGILFAIHQAGLLDFSRTWPLIIIVVGVMKLLERAFTPPGSAPQPPPFGDRPQ